MEQREQREQAAFDPKALALAYIDAVSQKQFERVSALLHPDLIFELADITHDKQDYIAALQRLGPILRRNDVKKVFVDGDDVCVIYDFVTDTAVGSVPSIEWLVVADGQIRSVRLIFERQRWPEVLEELGRRAGVAA